MAANYEKIGYPARITVQPISKNRDEIAIQSNGMRASTQPYKDCLDSRKIAMARNQL